LSCRQFAANILPIFFRCEFLRWFAFNYAAIEKLLRVQQFRFQFSSFFVARERGFILGWQTTGFKFVTATTNMTNAK